MAAVDCIDDGLYDSRRDSEIAREGASTQRDAIAASLWLESESSHEDYNHPERVTLRRVSVAVRSGAL